MKKAIVFIAAAFLLGCYFFPYRSDIITQKKAAIDLQNDFVVFRSVLEKGHPGLYKYTTKRELDFCFDSIYATLNTPQDTRTFNEKLAFIINKIGCSHTNVYLPEVYYDTIKTRKNFFPLSLIYVDGGLYVNTDQSEIPMGAHILSINNHSSEEVLSRTALYYVPDGRNKNYSRSQAAVDFAYAFFMAYGPAAYFDIEFAAAGNNTIQKVKIEPTTLLQYLRDYNINTYYYYPDEVGYDFEIIDSLQTAVLTLRSFSYSSAATFAAYKNFIKNSFTLLKNEPDITNLVIDCRNNTGGEYENIFLLNRFLSKAPFKENESASVFFDKVPYTGFLENEYAETEKPALDSMILKEFCRAENKQNSLSEADNTLHRPHPMAFNGTLFVITNNNVLSAASNFVAIIKDSRRGVIVGEETGGGYSGHNGFTRVLYKLPATGFCIEYSVVQVKHALQNPQLNKFGVQPDYYIGTTVQDVIDSQDPQLSFIINKLIKPALH